MPTSTEKPVQIDTFMCEEVNNF